MRLVASPELSEDDARAIQTGYENRQAVVERALIRAISSSEIPNAERDRLGFLAWLIAEELLDIRIAVVETSANKLGIYHEKFGVFSDSNNNKVVFSGSANESIGGLVSNFESIDVYRSWVMADTERAAERIADFESLWNNVTPNLHVFDFPEAAAKELLRHRPLRRPTDDPEEFEEIAKPVASEPQLPPSLVLRPYQEEAVRSWFRGNGVGMWEMATGTGKTLTALAALTKLYEILKRENRSLFAVIVCPFKHLVEQWASEAARFGIRPLLCFEDSSKWFPQLQDALSGQAGTRLPFLASITTNATFTGDAFQSALKDVSADFLLIGDEAHNLGAKHTRSKLPQAANYRLALSATPYRHFDEVGTKALFDYFGDTTYRLELNRAIEMGVLAPYDYIPVLITLEDDELEEYIHLTNKIGQMMGPADVELSADDLEEGPLKLFLIKRARLLGTAKGKLVTLRELMSGLRNTTHNLIYCSDASRRDETTGARVRQIDAVVRVLGTELQMHVNSYTHLTTTEERGRYRQDLASGELQALVAIRCLDEGVDIPEVRRGFILASSTNPRQFIQRRGRLLRTSAGKQQADLYDFIAVPPTDALGDSTFEIERKLVRRELERVVEFAGGAQNREQAMAALLELRNRYHLLDVG